MCVERDICVLRRDRARSFARGEFCGARSVRAHGKNGTPKWAQAGGTSRLDPVQRSTGGVDDEASGEPGSGYGHAKGG
eukprot:2090786-Pleurochrysis_carterae.AAC.1